MKTIWIVVGLALVAALVLVQQANASDWLTSIGDPLSTDNTGDTSSTVDLSSNSEGTDSVSPDDTGDGSNTGDQMSTPTTNQSFLARWARAIAPAENVNPAYNNPGGLNMAGDAGSTAAAGGTGHDVIGIFSTLDKGYQALQGVLSHYVTKYQDKTLLQATAIYIMGPNDPRTISGDYPSNVINEAKKVAANLGASINDTLGSLAGK